MNFLREWKRAKVALKSLDVQTITVLVTCVVFVFIQLTVGNRGFFLRTVNDWIPETWQGLASWGWWFGIQGISGFLLPVLILLFIFKQKPSEIGLGLGDWKLATILGSLYLPVVTIGTWILSDSLEFQSQYPHFQQASRDWGLFLVYEALFLFYWIGWEYLWRGYVLFGTAKTFGYYAIFIQTIPFAILHADKPLAEAFLSILGGIALGALVWRCRSFWIAVPIHAAQMMILDFWCSLRIRTGASGIGFEALIIAFGG